MKFTIEHFRKYSLRHPKLSPSLAVQQKPSLPGEIKRETAMNAASGLALRAFATLVLSSIGIAGLIAFADYIVI